MASKRIFDDSFYEDIVDDIIGSILAKIKEAPHKYNLDDEYMSEYINYSDLNVINTVFDIDKPDTILVEIEGISSSSVHFKNVVESLYRDVLRYLRNVDIDIYSGW